MLTLVMVLSMTACGGTGGDDSGNKAPAKNLQTAEMEIEASGLEDMTKATIGVPKNMEIEEKDWCYIITDKKHNAEIEAYICCDYSCYDYNQEASKEECEGYGEQKFGDFDGYYYIDGSGYYVEVYKEMKTIPAEQLEAFLQEAKKTGVYEMYYIKLATGLRRGELLGLKWQDIDWKNGIIKVRRQVARVDGEIVEAPLKTKNSYRAVTISQQAIEVLKTQKAKTNDTYVFPSPNGGPISPDSVNNMLKRVLTRAGISKVRFHDLRHTFATIALQKTVSGMLGHFSAGFTLDTYAHVTTSAQKEATETMGNILCM